MGFLDVVLREPVPPVGSERILDFDVENRPLTYGGRDYTFSEITIIAASFGPDELMHSWALGIDHPVIMLEGFRKLWDQADVVTGHYIRQHDLPMLSGAMLEYHLAPLSPKKTIDTCLDLTKHKGVSASQESLGDMLGIEFSKVQMTQADWRSANRLEPEGVKKAVDRCIGDVRQHMALRAKLEDLGMLSSPRGWSPFKASR